MWIMYTVVGLSFAGILWLAFNTKREGTDANHLSHEATTYWVRREDRERILKGV